MKRDGVGGGEGGWTKLCSVIHACACSLDSTQFFRDVVTDSTQCRALLAWGSSPPQDQSLRSGLAVHERTGIQDSSSQYFNDPFLVPLKNVQRTSKSLPSLSWRGVGDYDQKCFSTTHLRCEETGTVSFWLVYSLEK